MPDRGNLRDWLYGPGDARPGAPFLIEPDVDGPDDAGATVHTYGAVFDRAARLATVLAETGVRPGDRVVVQVPKSVTAVALYLACLHRGAIHVPLNPAFTADELAWFVTDADPALTVLAADRHRDATVVDRGTVHTIDELSDRAEQTGPAPIAPRAGDDIAALLYTSGTTGRPKGAALTHDNLWHNARALHEAWHFEPDDRLLHVLPIFHVHGLFVALHCAMGSAVPVTFLPRFDIDAVLAGLRGATVMMGVPTHYTRLLADPRFDRDLAAGMRLFTCGSAPLSDTVFDEFTERTGHRICERYGMSEAGIMTSNPYHGERIAGTVGFPLRDVELRVCDDAGHPVGAGVTGIIEVRGPHLFAGYWRRDDATTAAHRSDGWFVTGDVGRLDPDGRLTLEGRAGDMIISGGENIYPKEIELVLDRVDGVVESAVIGVPHPDLGEAVVAVLVVTPDSTAQDRDRAVDAALCAALARFKHPRARRVVDALPRNAMGKVQKEQLRREFADVFTERRHD